MESDTVGFVGLFTSKPVRKKGVRLLVFI